MALIVAFAVATVVTPIVAVVARRVGLVDRPGPHKPQAQPVAYLGGVAVFVALAGPVAAARPSLLIPAALALALGLADDVFDLRPQVRLPVELLVGVAAALVVPARGVAGAVTTVAFVVVLLNAVNLIDGLDGLAAGVGLAAAVGFAVILAGGAATSALALAGALGGFLVWNRPPARIYLGDAGSYLVGTFLAMLLAAAFGEGQSVATGASALLLVAVPVADTSIAIVRRWRAGRPLLQGDRGHVYDQLVDRGWSTSRATLACVGAQVLFAIVAVAVSAASAVVAVVTVSFVVVVTALVSVRAFTTPGSWVG